MTTLSLSLGAAIWPCLYFLFEKHVILTYIFNKNIYDIWKLKAYWTRVRLIYKLNYRKLKKKKKNFIGFYLFINLGNRSWEQNKWK